MRENRLSGSEGGGAESNRLFLPLSVEVSGHLALSTNYSDFLRSHPCHDGRHSKRMKIYSLFQGGGRDSARGMFRRHT